MKYPLILLWCLLLCGCSDGNKPLKIKTEEKLVEQKPDTIACMFGAAALAGKTYDFSMTYDKNYCNRDSLVEGDCNSGYFYFTPKGNVIYHYFCVNPTEEDYCIGKAEYNSKGLLLSFDDCYVYKIADEMSGPTLKELNNGKVEKYDFSFQLVALKDCPGSYGYTTNGKDPEYYLIHEAKDYSLNEYPLNEIKKIKALQKY